MLQPFILLKIIDFSDTQEIQAATSLVISITRGDTDLSLLPVALAQKS